MILTSLLLAASLSTSDATLFVERLAGNGYGPPRSSRWALSPLAGKTHGFR